MATKEEIVGYQPPTLEVAEDYVPPPPPQSHILRDIALVSLGILIFIFAGSFHQLIIPFFIAYLALWVFVGIPKRIAWRLEKLKPPPQNDPIDPAKIMHYTIRLQRDTEADGHVWHHFLEHLLLEVSRITLRIEATKAGIVWQLLDIRGTIHPDFIVRSVKAHFPEASVEKNSYQRPPFKQSFYRAVLKWKFGTIFPAPITVVDDLKNFDPLIPMTQAMIDLEENERVVYTVVVTGKAYSAETIGETLITNPKVTFAEGIGAIPEIRHQPAPNTAERFTRELQNAMREKLSQPLFTVLVMLQIDGGSEKRIDELWSAATQLQQFTKPRLNYLIPFEQKRVQEVDSETSDQQSDTLALHNSYLTNTNEEWKQFLLVLEPRELAALWHLPDVGFTASGIGWQKSKQVRMPDELAQNKEGVYIGQNEFAGNSTPVFLRYPDRATHMAVFGMTGTGKTNFLHTVIAQDIANGKGVCVVDPLGNLVRNLLRYSIPRDREGDVIVLDVGNEAYPPPFNIMTLPTEAGVESASSRVMSILAKLFPDMPGTRWADTFAMALLTLKAEQPATIRDVDRVLFDIAYRDKLLARTNNEALYSYWAEDFDRESENMQRELTRPIKRHLRAFFGNPYFYPISCHPQGIDFSKRVQEGKIILVSLGVDESKLTAYERRLMGALLISQIQMAATSHAAERSGFYLFVDEAQEFITTSLSTMLTQARQFNLSLTLANQYLGQLVGNTLEAIRGDVGAFVFFQLGDQDAGIAARYTRPNFTAEDLMTLDKYQAAVRVRLGTSTLPAFSLSTFLAYDEKIKTATENEARIRALSCKTYTPMTREAVLAWLRERYPRKTHGDDDDENLSDPL